MEITTPKGYIQIKISTNNVDFDTLMEQINDVPKTFRTRLINHLGMSPESFYLKKREKSFKLLECQKLSELTGINPNRL